MKDRGQRARQEEWKKRIEEQEKSGLSQKEFCRQYNLTPGQFGYYKGLLRPKDMSNLATYNK